MSIIVNEHPIKVTPPPVPKVTTSGEKAGAVQVQDQSAQNAKIQTSGTTEARLATVGALGPIGPKGSTGLQGIQGIQGIPGPAGTTYVHTQSSASSVWTVHHDLNKYPAVTVVDSANERVEGDVDYIDLNTVVITFSAPFGGQAFLT